ncbi:MAG TPA: cation:proton antiporter, partial [Gammaproteobacteria bacterium]|nr:cation:proton antiporter [Gammaproteobacteria bacterium]
MDIPQHVIGFFIVLMLAALLVEPLARRLHLPFSAVLVLTGLAGAQVLVAAGIDLGLRWFQFHDMVLYVLLPVIVFEAALTLDLRQVRADLVVLAVLALPVTLVSAAVTAALFLAGTGHAAEVGWGTALLAGTLLSATDPAAVLDLFHRAGVPHRLSLLAEGESLFNSGLVVVAAGLLLERVLDGTGGDGGLLLSGRFVWLCAGGAAVGALIGAGTVALLERLTDAVRQGLASLTGS